MFRTNKCASSEGQSITFLSNKKNHNKKIEKTYMIKKTLNCIQHSISQVSIQNLGIVFEEKGHSTKTIDMKPTLYI